MLFLAIYRVLFENTFLYDVNCIGHSHGMHVIASEKKFIYARYFANPLLVFFLFERTIVNISLHIRAVKVLCKIHALLTLNLSFSSAKILTRRVKIGDTQQYPPI